MVEFKKGRRRTDEITNTMIWESRCGDYRVVESTSLPYFSTPWVNIAAMQKADWGWDFLMRTESNAPYYHRSIAAAKEACGKYADGKSAEFVRVPCERKTADGTTKKSTRRKLVWS